MKDVISVKRIDELHPLVRAAFKKFIEDCETGYNITIRVVQGYRTFAEQQAIYDQGRTKPGNIVTNAKPGSSYHNWGLAVDLGVLANGKIDWGYDYKRFVHFMPEGMTWGGDWDGDGKTKADGDKDEHLVDYPHFEIKLGSNWHDLLVKRNNKQFIPGTDYINLS